ncbi:MAG: hypothetical protein JST26_06955 [Bacteroidetes bacterium]|nr:hypothetical protein [Bacteroidota bacterium]
MNQLSLYFFGEPRHLAATRVFRKALYALLLYRILVGLRHFDDLFGVNSLIYTKHISLSGVKDLVYLLNIYELPWLRLSFLIAGGIICLAGIFNRQSFVTNVLLALVIYNIHSYLYSALTAGDYLLNMMVFFNCFLYTKPRKNIVLNELSTAAHNASLLALKIQVCLAYVLAAYYKLGDNSWLHGEAVFRSFQADVYSSHLLHLIPHGVAVCMNYAVIAYQGLFAGLVWIKPLKKWILWLGVAQHLFIAFGMGLMSFGFTMIISYLLFPDFTKKD